MDLLKTNQFTSLLALDENVCLLLSLYIVIMNEKSSNYVTTKTNYHKSQIQILCSIKKVNHWSESLVLSKKKYAKQPI